MQRRDSKPSDLVTSLCSSLLEGLLSADNAMVLAVLVLGLPKHEQQKALRYGILGAFVFRALATLLAVYLIQLGWVKLLGRRLPAVSGLPPLLQARRRTKRGARRRRRQADVRAVGLLGDGRQGRADRHRVRHRLDPRRRGDVAEDVGDPDRRHPRHHHDAAGDRRLLAIVERYPPLVDGAFIIIAWVGIKLLIEYLHVEGYMRFEIPKWLSLGLIVVIFARRVPLRAAGAAARRTRQKAAKTC